ncbi:FAD-binding oxidoreductase [Pseudonocardia ailaonensis]|uniref:FAD-binding oxidoreductase n=1 Tax=Pseudonocardia ailaonensis TaxID=367279 RepID=A0ABN2NRB7_9PSEU
MAAVTLVPPLDQGTEELPAARSTRRTAQLVRRIRTATAPYSDPLARRFHAELFARVPRSRHLFPVSLAGAEGLHAILYALECVDRRDDLYSALHALADDPRLAGLVVTRERDVDASLVAALGAHAGEEWTAEGEWAVREAFRLVAGALRTIAPARVPEVRHAEVIAHRRIGWDLAVLTVRPERPLAYRAGQYLDAETPRRPQLWRRLSPANAPRADGTIDFHVRAVEGGWVSRSIVAHTRPGDVWRIGCPRGRLVADAAGPDLLMVAGGTGAAPVLAMVEELARAPRAPRVDVVVGGRTWADLVAFPALRRLADTHPWLRAVPVVEDPADTSGAEHGTVADVVTRQGAWADRRVLLSGSPAMIRATAGRMLVAGTPLDRLVYDPFTTREWQ